MYASTIRWSKTTMETEEKEKGINCKKNTKSMLEINQSHIRVGRTTKRNTSRKEISKSHVNKMSVHSFIFMYVEDNEHE